MKAFIRKVEFTPEYPEDLKKVREYLEERGTVNCDDRDLDTFYRYFCSRVADAGWLTVQSFSDYWLERFSEWLENHEVNQAAWIRISWEDD